MSNVVERIHARAAERAGRVVLSEGHDPRTLRAARTLVDNSICSITVLGTNESVSKAAAEAGVEINGIDVVDPGAASARAEYAEQLAEARAKKGVTPTQAHELMADQLLFAAYMVRNGAADATVGGAVNSTADVVRAALWGIGVRQGVSVVSGGFIMVVPDFLGTGEDKVLYFADCGVVPNPDATQLASIAIASADTFHALTGEDPRIAMLSFSTKGSAKHGDVDKVIEATRLAMESRPDLEIDGELQADAALIASIGERKSPGSNVAGKANVLVFPDLGAGNIAYKLVQRLAKATALGPILQGLGKPAHDLSRGCSAEDIVDMAAIALCMTEK